MMHGQNGWLERVKGLPRLGQIRPSFPVRTAYSYGYGRYQESQGYQGQMGRGTPSATAAQLLRAVHSNRGEASCLGE